MARFNHPLNDIRVAAPCSADWEQMLGDERVRFCSQCQLNVYNLSGMSKREAESLITQTEGRLCVRFYRRADGSILTRNCPVGLSALKRRMSRIATAAASALLGLLAGVGLNSFAELAGKALLDGGSQRYETTVGALVAEPKPRPPIKTADEPLVMGRMVVDGPDEENNQQPNGRRPVGARPRQRIQR